MTSRARREQLLTVSFVRGNQGPEAQLENREVHHPARQKAQIKGMRKGTRSGTGSARRESFLPSSESPSRFLPEKFSGVLLSGMCVPDLKGSQGTFCLCTTRKSDGKFREGGVRVAAERNGNGVHSYIPGPEDPLGTHSELRAAFVIRPDVAKNQATIEIDSEKGHAQSRRLLGLAPCEIQSRARLQRNGHCSLLLKEVSPEVEVYVTRSTSIPRRPDLPISHPVTYSIYLAKMFGPYATLGLAEDTSGSQRRSARRRRVPGAVLREP